MENMNIKLKGLNRRGKTRINNFSDDGTFILKDRRDSVACFLNLKGDFILVKSLKPNMKIGDLLEPWSGWFQVGVDVEIIP